LTQLQEVEPVPDRAPSSADATADAVPTEALAGGLVRAVPTDLKDEAEQALATRNYLVHSFMRDRAMKPHDATGPALPGRPARGMPERRR
jgi:hypothetical protein